MSRFALPVVLVAVMLTGCAPTVDDAAPAPTTNTVIPSPTPTPTPTPTKPALEQLALSTDGLGPLRLGEPVPELPIEQSTVVFNPAFCPDTAEPGRWWVNYPSDVHAPFFVGTSGGVIDRIDVVDSRIMTDVGVHVGTTIDDVLHLYPDGFVDRVEGMASDAYIVEGERGELAISVSNNLDAWGSIGEVVVMRVYAPGYPREWMTAAPNGNVAGNCGN